MDEHPGTGVESNRARLVGGATVAAGALILSLAAAGAIWVVGVVGGETYRGHFGGVSALGELALLATVTPSALILGVVGVLYVRVGLRARAQGVRTAALGCTGLASLGLIATMATIVLAIDVDMLWRELDAARRIVVGSVCVALAAHGMVTSVLGRPGRLR